MKKLILLPILMVLVVGGLMLYQKNQADKINSFADCATAGNPIMTSYPGQCRTRDGRLFVEDIGNELELREAILVDSPRPNTQVTNPLVISGRARGNWYFEASFPAELVDEKGSVIGTVVVQADGDWMSEDFVPFTATLTFTSTDTKTGNLLLHNSNPSALPENDKTLSIPVNFSN